MRLGPDQDELVTKCQSWVLACGTQKENFPHMMFHHGILRVITTNKQANKNKAKYLTVSGPNNRLIHN